MPVPTKKAICLLVLFAFISRDVVWAGFPGFSGALASEIQTSIPVELPFDMGTVESFDYPQGNPHAPVVFQIKTLHGHYETAVQVRNIIRFLKEQYGVDLLFAEGASGKLHPEYLNFVQDPEKNARAVDKLVQKGEATGVDLSLLDGPLEALGVEDTAAYKMSLASFKKVVGSLGKNESLLEERRLALEKSASKVLDAESRDLLSQWLNFNSGRRDFLATVKYLQAEAQSSLGIDFQTPFAQFEWPQLTRLVLMTDLEKKRNEEKLKSEKAELEMKFAAVNRPAQDFLALVTSQTDSPSASAPQIPSRRLVENFISEAKKAGISLRDYPQILYFAARKVLENELDSRVLYEEMEKLFDDILENEMGTPEQRQIVRQYQDLMLTRKLLNLEMSPRDWEDWVRSDAGASADPSLKESIAEAENFYRGVDRREEAFLDHAVEGFKNKKHKTAVLVTGGFHSSGIKDRLRSKGMGLVVITPHVSGDFGNDLYRKIMMRSAGLEQTLLTNAPEASLAQGWDIAGQSAAVRQALREEGFDVDTKGPYFAAVQESLSKRSELRMDEQEFIELIHSARGPQLDVPLRPNDPDWVAQLNPEFIQAHREEFITGINELADALGNDGRVLANGISYIDLSAAYGFHLEQVDSLLLMAIGTVLGVWTILSDIRKEGDTSPVHEQFPLLHRIDFKALGRAELRTADTQTGYELVEKELDVRTLFPEDQQDKPLNQIVFVSDNTGTMVQGYGDPLSGTILEDSIKLLGRDGFFLLVNSGDPLKDLAEKTYTPLLEGISASGREHFHIVADGGSRRIGFAADASVRYREELESWPKARRFEYAKTLADAFYKELKKRQGVLEEALKDIPDSKIDAIRDERMAALEAIGPEAWGEKKADEAKYIFDLLPQDFLKGWGRVFVYDVGPKVSFDAPSLRDFLPAEFTPGIMAEVQKKYPAGTEDLYVVSVPGAVDMARVSKIEGVSKTLNEQIYQHLDPNQPLLMIVIGDGDNDIPTFSLKGPAGFQQAVVPVFLRSLLSYATRLPEGTFIAEDKMAGTAKVLDHLAQHAGKKISEIPPLKLRQWVRSELRAGPAAVNQDVSRGPLLTREALLGLKFMAVSSRAMGDKDEIFVQVEGIPEGLYVHRNVFNPAIKNVSSPLLGQVLEINPGDNVLDIGSGTGYQGIIAFKKGADKVLATDVSDEAVSNIERNIQHLGLKGKLEARKSDLFEGIGQDEKFDLIIFSPPLLAGRPSSILERSIYDDQRNVLKRFFEGASRHLAPGGRIQMIFSQSAMEDLQELLQGKWNIEVLETKTYERRNQGYNLLKLQPVSAAEAVRSELRTEESEAIGLDGRLKGLDLYEKVFSQAPDTTLRVGRDIAHTGALQAAAIIKGIQAKRKAYDAAGQKDRDVFIIFATGNTQWLGLTTLASILDSWGSWDDETRQLLTQNGVDLSDKPDMSRIFATHLDTIFPQSRDDYYSYANELHNMFDKLGISREKRRMFYGDVKNDQIEPDADNKMDKAAFEKVQASIDQEGLKLDEFLKGQLASDHPQYAYLDAVNRYTKKMAEFVLAKGPDIALFSAGPSYEGKGHFAFNEAGTPFDQGLVMSLLSYHAAAGNIKDRGGMQHFRTQEGAIKIGGATLGPKEIRSSHPIFITIINGKEKRESVRSLVEREADIQYPMTALQAGAPGSVLIMESASGSTLRYFTNTWDFVEIPARDWNADLQAKLFVRLSKETGKPVAALTVDDWLQSQGKDQSEIAAIRTKNLIALTTFQPWEVLRDEVVKTLNKEPLKSEQVPARLGLRPGDEIVHIGPHLDDLSLAAQFLVSEFSKQGHRLYSYYTAPGYTAVSDEYVLSALGTLKDFNADELADLAGETSSVFAFKQNEEKYLRQLIKVLAARGLAYDPMNYDTWSQMPAEEQKLRAKLLFLRLNFESSLKGQLSSPERISALREALEIYIQAKPHWGSSEIVVMQKLKVALRFVEEQTELMSRGVGYEDIFFPFQSSWYALERKGTARQSDIDVIKDVIRTKKPRMVIVNGEGFMDHGAHSITEMTVKVAVKELYEEGALPDGFRMFFYRGVWDRAEITGRPDQILVALGEEELNENKSSFVRNYPSQAPALVPDASVKEPMFFSDQVVTNARETLAEWAGLNGRKTDDPALQGILAFDMIDFNSRSAVQSFLAEVVAKKTELDRVQVPINRASLSKIIGSAPPYADLSGQPGEKFLSVLAAAGFPFEAVLTKEEIEKTKVDVRSELRSGESEWQAGDQVKDTQFLDTVYTIESINASGKVRFTSGLEVSERQLGIRFIRVSPAPVPALSSAEQEFTEKAAAAGLHAGESYGIGQDVYTLVEAVNHPQYGWAFLFRVEKSGKAPEQGYLIPEYFQQFKQAARLIVDAEFETVQEAQAPETEVYAPVVSKPADQGLIKKHLEGERAADLTADEELWNLLPSEVREKIERVIAEYRDHWKAGDIEREDGFSDEKRAVKIAWKGTIRGEAIDGIIVSGVLFNRDNIGEDFRGLNWGSTTSGTEELDEETIRESAISVHVAADGRPDLRPAAFAQKGGHGGKTAAKKFANARTVLPQKGLRTPVAVGFALYTPEHIRKDGEPLGVFISAHRQSEKRFKTYQEKAVTGLLRGYADAMADVKRRALTTFQITYFDPSQVIPGLLKENNIDQLSEVYGRELRKVVDGGLYPHSPHFANFEADPSGRVPTTWHDLGGWEVREDLTTAQAFGYAYMTLTYAILNLKIRFGNRLEEFYKAGYINPYDAFLRGFFHDQLTNPDFDLNDFKLDHDGRSSLEYAAYDVVYRDAPQTLSPLYKRLDQPFVKVLRTVMGMPVTSEERSSFKPDSGSRISRPRPLSKNVSEEEWEDGEGVGVHRMYEAVRQSVGMDAVGPQFVQEYIVPELKALITPEDIDGVVEYGAGAGTLWDWAHDGFADWYPGNPRYPSWIQTDMNMDALRYSRGRVKKVIPVDLRNEPIPFKDKAAAVSWAGLDTLPVPVLPAVIRDIAGTLKPGGKLIVGLDMGSSITTEVYEAQRNGWVAFPYFTEIAPGEWRPTGMMTIDWNLMKSRFQPKMGETAVWGMIRQYMTVYTANPSSPEAVASQSLQSASGTANLKLISQWLAEKSRETQTLKHVTLSRPALHLERVKRAAEAAGFSIQSAGIISKTYLVDRSAIPALHPSVNHIIYSEGMVVQQAARGVEKGKVRIDAKFHLLTAVKTGEPKEALAYKPLGIEVLNGGRLDGSKPLIYQMAKLISAPAPTVGKEEAKLSTTQVAEIIEGVIREVLKSDKITKPRKRFDEAAAVKSLAKELSSVSGKLSERDVNSAFIKARLGFTQAGYGANIADRLNEALGRSELRMEDAQLWPRLIEIAEGRTPSTDELERLEALLDQDPAQSVTAQYFGVDKKKIVADRIEVLRKVWPAFREFWKTQVLSDDIPVDSLWRVYLPLAQWALAEKRSRRPDELFVLGIGGAIGSGKTTLSRVMALLLNEMLDENEGQAVASSLDDYYLPRETRQQLREKGYAPGMKVNRALPGTQDVAWVERIIQEMEKSGPDSVIELPRFSKLKDDHEAPALIKGKVGVFVFEGWLNGANSDIDVSQVEPGLKRVVAEELRKYKPVFDRFDGFFAFPRPTVERMIAGRIQQDEHQAKTSGKREFTDEQIASLIRYWEVDYWQPPVTSPAPRNETTTLWIEADEARKIMAVRAGGRWALRSELRGMEEKKSGWFRDELGLTEEDLISLAAGDSVRWRMRDLRDVLDKRFPGRVSTLTAAGGAAAFAHSLGLVEPYKAEIERVYDDYLGYAEKTAEALALTDFRMLSSVYEKLYILSGKTPVKLSDRPVRQRTFLSELPARLSAFNTDALPHPEKGKPHLALFLKERVGTPDGEAFRKELLAWLNTPDENGKTWNLSVFRGQFLELFPEYDSPRFDHGFLLWTLDLAADFEREDEARSRRFSGVDTSVGQSFGFTREKSTRKMRALRESLAALTIAKLRFENAAEAQDIPYQPPAALGQIQDLRKLRVLEALSEESGRPVDAAAVLDELGSPEFQWNIPEFFRKHSSITWLRTRGYHTFFYAAQMEIPMRRILRERYDLYAGNMKLVAESFGMAPKAMRDFYTAMGMAPELLYVRRGNFLRLLGKDKQFYLERMQKQGWNALAAFKEEVLTEANEKLKSTGTPQLVLKNISHADVVWGLDLAGEFLKEFKRLREEEGMTTLDASRVFGFTGEKSLSLTLVKRIEEGVRARLKEEKKLSIYIFELDDLRMRLRKAYTKDHAAAVRIKRSSDGVWETLRSGYYFESQGGESAFVSATVSSILGKVKGPYQMTSQGTFLLVEQAVMAAPAVEEPTEPAEVRSELRTGDEGKESLDALKLPVLRESPEFRDLIEASESVFRDLGQPFATLGMQTDGKPDAAKANVRVVLGSQDIRLFQEAARIFSESKQNTPLIISGGRGRGTPGLESSLNALKASLPSSRNLDEVLRNEKVSEAELIGALFNDLKEIPEQSFQAPIILETESKSTYQNLENVVRMLRSSHSSLIPAGEKPRIVIYVTEPQTARTVSAMIRRLQAEGLDWEFMVTPAYQLDFARLDDSATLDFVFKVIGIPKAFAEGRDFKDPDYIKSNLDRDEPYRIVRDVNKGSERYPQNTVETIPDEKYPGGKFSFGGGVVGYRYSQSGVKAVRDGVVLNFLNAMMIEAEKRKMLSAGTLSDDGGRSELRKEEDSEQLVQKIEEGLDLLEALIEDGKGGVRITDFNNFHALLEPLRVRLLKTRRVFSEQDIQNEIVPNGVRNGFLASYRLPSNYAETLMEGLRSIARLARTDRRLATTYAERWFEAVHIQVLHTEQPRQILVQIFGEWPVWADSVEKIADGLTRGGSLPEVQGGFRDHVWRSAGVRAEAGKVVIEKAGRTVFSAAFDELHSSQETRRNFRHALRVLLESKRYDYQRSELRADAIQPASPVFAAQFRNYSLPAEGRERSDQEPEKPVTVSVPDTAFTADSREVALYMALRDVLPNHAVLGFADVDSQDGALLTKPSDLKDTAILKSWFLVPRSIDEAFKTQLFQQLKPGGLLIMAFEEGIVPDPAQFGGQAQTSLPPEIANAVYGSVQTQVRRRADVIPYVIIQKARSELRSQSGSEEENAARLLFRHLAAESKDIPADHALVVLGNPYEGYAEAVVKKAHELNSPEIVIVGKGGAAEPERVRLRREILAIDPALASKIKGFDSVDESMHTGMNVTSLAQAVKDGAIQSKNFVLTQIPTGGLLSLRIFEHQWKQNAESMGLPLKEPGFYFVPVDYPFDIEAPLTDSKEQRFYLEHAAGQIDRLKAWPLNPNPPLVLKEGDLTPEILAAADTVRTFLTRSELRSNAVTEAKIRAIIEKWVDSPEVTKPARYRRGETVKEIVADLSQRAGQAFTAGDINSVFQRRRLNFKSRGKGEEIAAELNAALLPAGQNTGEEKPLDEAPLLVLLRQVKREWESIFLKIYQVQTGRSLRSSDINEEVLNSVTSEIVSRSGGTLRNTADIVLIYGAAILRQALVLEDQISELHSRRQDARHWIKITKGIDEISGTILPILESALDRTGQAPRGVVRSDLVTAFQTLKVFSQLWGQEFKPHAPRYSREIRKEDFEDLKNRMILRRLYTREGFESIFGDLSKLFREGAETFSGFSAERQIEIYRLSNILGLKDDFELLGINLENTFFSPMKVQTRSEDIRRMHSEGYPVEVTGKTMYSQLHTRDYRDIRALPGIQFPTSQAKVLSLAGGRGLPLAELAPLFDNSTLVLLDANGDNVRNALSVMDALPQTNTYEAKLADARSGFDGIAYPEGSFDLITMVGRSEYGMSRDDLEEIVKEAFRVMKREDGYFLIESDGPDFLERYKDAAVKLARRQEINFPFYGYMISSKVMVFVSGQPPARSELRDALTPAFVVDELENASSKRTEIPAIRLPFIAAPTGRDAYDTALMLGGMADPSWDSATLNDYRLALRNAVEMYYRSEGGEGFGEQVTKLQSLLRDSKQVIAPFAHIRDISKDETLRQIFDTARFLIVTNQAKANYVVLAVDREEDVEPLREKLLNFLKTEYPEDAAMRNQIYSRMPVVTSSSRMIGTLIPKGALSAWVDWTADGDAEGGIPEMAKDKRIQADRLPGGALLKFDEKNRGYGVSLLQAAVLLLQGAEESRLQQVKNGLFVQASASVFASLGQLFKALRNISVSA